MRGLGTEEKLDLYTKALVENKPTDEDIKPAPLPEEAKKKPLTAIVAELDGPADMKLGDGTWIQLNKGDFIPNDATVYTGYDSTMEIRFSDRLVVILRSLDELNIHQFETDASVYRTELKLESGELRFEVLEGTLKTDMKVSTPVCIAGVTGTDVGISHDKEKGISVWEIYDGTLEITNIITNEKKIISSAYGMPIKRIEATKDGAMVEKIAIPQSERDALANQQKPVQLAQN